MTDEAQAQAQATADGATQTSDASAAAGDQQQQPAADTKATPPAGDKPADDKAAADAATTADGDKADKPKDGDAKPGESDTGKPTDDQAADTILGAPETYEFKASSEDGDFNPAVMDAFSGVMKELDLNQAAAQKILDTVAPVMAQQQQALFQDIQKGWVDSVQTDKEYGGEQLEANLAIAKRAIDAYASKELKEYLRSTGIGNHPEWVRFAWKVGQTVKEDDILQGGTPPPSGGKKGETPKEKQARTLYGDGSQKAA